MTRYKVKIKGLWTRFLSEEEFKKIPMETIEEVITGEVTGEIKYN